MGATLESPRTTTPVSLVDDAATTWPTRGTAMLLSAVAVVGFAVLSGLLTPRGPLTNHQAAATLVIAAVVGGVVGHLLATRWTLLAAPVLYVAVFEVTRIGVEGPTVDLPQLDSTLGVLAFVVGRVVHATVVLLPMVVGAAAGIWLAARRRHPTAAAPGRLGVVVLAVASFVGVFVLAVLLQPARTTPILGEDGEVLDGSVSELVSVEIGGVEQTLMLRGRDVEDPVLLYLSGGPGGTDLGAMRDDTGLEDHVVVATWEQRGAGKSYATSIDPVEDLTLEQAVADTIEVAEHLRERFGRDQVLVAANSWGTIPSTLAVQQRPDLFRAYIGTGQMVDPLRTDQMFFDDALEWAEATGRDDLAQRMRDTGPPPYDDLTDYELTAGYEHQWNAYPGVDQLDEMPLNTFVRENTWMDRINAARAMFDVNWFVYPQLQGVDLSEQVTSLDVPVTVVHGAHEARGRDVLARAWFEQLDAPSKQLVVFDDSGHRPLFEEPARFADVVADVLEATEPR